MLKHLLNLLIFLVIWCLVGMSTVHFFFPSLWESEEVLHTVPWVMLIGYIIGTGGTMIADAITKTGRFKR